MKYKDLKINFRHLSGNIACLSVNSISGEIVHNDINDEEAIIIIKSLVGKKENCQTVKSLLEENEKLKKQLEEANKKLYLCTPEIPRNVHGEYVSYVDLVNEIYELNKQLEDMTDCRDIANGHRKEVQDRETILLKQQQEFLKYLEDEIERKRFNATCMFEYNDTVLPLKEILQKYKEIIGAAR